MIAEKRQMGLLIFDDNTNKIAVADSRTEALWWWRTLSKKAKKQVLSKHGFNFGVRNPFGWNELIKMYRSVHHRSGSKSWWSSISNTIKSNFIKEYCGGFNQFKATLWVDQVHIYSGVHNLSLT